MSEFALEQLRLLVQKAVRPLRATGSRKADICADLLAHVLDIYEQELATLGDERLTLERTARRFGNPAELTEQLHESIPAVGKRLTKSLNLLLLIAPPFGTALGIYGLWKVDRVDRNLELPSASS